MKRLAFSLVSVLLLAACGASSTVTYDLSMDVTDMEMRQELMRQSLRVMERRLDRMGEIMETIDSSVTDTAATATIAVEHTEAFEQLTAELQEPFELAVMSQAEEGQTPDATVEGHGSFVRTGITGDDLEWVQGREAEDGLGEVRLVFTPEGRTKMADLFSRMSGKNIGLFVRGQLVSKLQVDTAELKEDIVIREIPTADLALIFADDVNVGIHVTFTPVP